MWCQMDTKKTLYTHNMNLAKHFISLFLFLHMITNLADSQCQPFQCGNLSTLQFPLSNIQNPRCGLLTVDCNNPSSPSIQLGDGGSWYDVLQRLSEHRFRIRDPILQSRLNTSNCNSFRRSLSLPSSPSVSLTISSPVLTSFQCNDPPLNQNSGLIDQYFFAQNYTRFPGCPGFVVFYRSPANGSYNGEFAVPEDCQAVRLPFGGSENWEQSSGIFSGLSAEFDVEWNVSSACLDCNRRGGRCGTDSINEFVCRQEVGNKILRIILITGGVILAALSATLIVLLILFRKQYTITSKWPIIHRVKTGKEKDIELFLNEGNIVTRRYKYAYIKKITKSLKEKLGEGGYGSVYKGQLPDGRLVAVKMLNESKGNGGEFINEVASISRTSHINIVTLLGFCFEGSKRALVYEFMHNGSLEKYIQNAEEGLGLGWEKLTDIALGIARGLEYLHQGCNTRILHFDMKPHNILLDKDFNPKISDFGLAKLCPNRSSIVSMLGARGTVGYIAPEVFCRNFGEVSYKSDVYSYGMIVLEMAGGTKNIDRDDVDRTSEIYFPQYIYKELEMDAKGGDGTDGIMDEDESQFAKRKLIIVGLWCIQTDPKNRPSMSKVVEMLEGKLESLHVPPNPYYFSPIPKAPPSFSTSRSL